MASAAASRVASSSALAATAMASSTAASSAASIPPWPPPLLDRLDRLLDDILFGGLDLGLRHLAGDHGLGRLFDGLVLSGVDLGLDELGLDDIGDRSAASSCEGRTSTLSSAPDSSELEVCVMSMSDGIACSSGDSCSAI